MYSRDRLEEPAKEFVAKLKEARSNTELMIEDVWPIDLAGPIETPADTAETIPSSSDDESSSEEFLMTRSNTRSDVQLMQCKKSTAS